MKTYFVDAFTNQMFKGNPAAVCMVDSSISEGRMQNIATEIGFSETAFVQSILPNSYSIRFFTPKKEIPLCGHATLAASKVLFETKPIDQIIFKNIEGLELRIEKAGSKIKMQLPVYETEPTTVPNAMLDALGIMTFIKSRYCPEPGMILIEIAGTDILKNLKPDFVALVKSYSGINGVLVTAKAENEQYDFHYRYFWPWAGTDEDPVTGAVQTFLTKYWADKLHKKELHPYQSSARTGIMNTEFEWDHVFIYGEAVIVMEGEWNIIKQNL